MLNTAKLSCQRNARSSGRLLRASVEETHLVRWAIWDAETVVGARIATIRTPDRIASLKNRTFPDPLPHLRSNYLPPSGQALTPVSDRLGRPFTQVPSPMRIEAPAHEGVGGRSGSLCIWRAFPPHPSGAHRPARCTAASACRCRGRLGRQLRLPLRYVTFGRLCSRR